MEIYVYIYIYTDRSWRSYFAVYIIFCCLTPYSGPISPFSSGPNGPGWSAPVRATRQSPWRRHARIVGQ